MYPKRRRIYEIEGIQRIQKWIKHRICNVETGRHIPLEQAVVQINKSNKNYKNYQVVNKANGTTYICSKADGIKKNNIEE